MGLCADFRREIRLANFGFRGVRIERFCYSQWRVPVGVYLAYRLVLMVYGLFWLIYTSFHHGTPPQAWGAYLTNWSYVLLNIYLVSHCLLAVGVHLSRLCKPYQAGVRVSYCCHRPSLDSYRAMFYELSGGDSQNGYNSIPGGTASVENGDVGGGGEGGYHSSGSGNSSGSGHGNISPDLHVTYAQPPSLPIFACFVWVTYSAISAAAVMVSIVFFAFLFPAMNDYPEIGLENLQVHLLNSVIVLIEHLVSAVPYRLLHVVYPITYGVIYMLFSLIYWAGDHDRVMYPHILDWNQPATTVGFICLIGFVFIPALHLFFFVIYKAVMLIVKRYCISDS